MKIPMPLQMNRKRDRWILGGTVAAVVIIIIAIIVLCVSCGKKKNPVEPSQSLSSDSLISESGIGESEAAGDIQTESKTETEIEGTEGTEGNTSDTGPSVTPSEPTSNTSHGACPSKDGALQVIGTQLCNSKGEPVQLRGISTHGLAWFPEYVNDTLFGEFHDNWGANVMRLAMYSAEYNGYCTGGNKTSLKTLVQNGVTYATNHDMYVIIDWHVLGDLTPLTYKDEAISFFKEMSSLYKDYNNVIYEICNEPNGGTSWADVKSYALEVIPVIKANDPDAVIIVGTPTWSQDVDQAAAAPITGYTNIMYTLHFYAATHKDDLRNKMVNALAAGIPIFVTEYGICDASGNGAIDYESANAWADTMDKYGISYVAWNLSNKDETSSIISSGVSKTSGLAQSDLSASGLWLYKRLTESTGAAGISQLPSASTGTSTGAETGAETGASGGNISGNSSGNSNTNQPVAENKITATATVDASNSWGQEGAYYYQLNISVTNGSTATSTAWSCDISFSSSFTIESGWSANYSINGNTLHAENADFNGSLSVGETTTIGLIICSASPLY